MSAEGGYKFGDLSRKLAKDVKAGLDKVGQDVTGNSSYEFGSLTRGMLSKLKEEAGRIDLQMVGSDVRERLASYEFGSITKSILASEWGQQAMSSATDAGRALTGNPDYQVGDLTKGLISRLEGITDRAAKIIALPDDVGELRQIVLEQQLLIQSLTDGEVGASSVKSGKFLLPEASSGDELKSMVVDNQEIIDIVLSSREEDTKK